MAQKISRILIVDDHEDNALFFKVLLMNQQVPSVSICSSPLEAQKVIEDKRIQFLIIAWEMSDVSGPVFVQKIREQRHLRFLPIVIYSRTMSEAEKNLTKELGLFNILSFPATEKEATECITQMIKHEENLDPLELRIRDAEKLLGTGQLEPALGELKPALVKGPFFGRAQSLLAEIYLAQNKLKEAEETLQTALEFEDSRRSKRLLAMIHQKNGKHGEAIAVLKQISKTSPFNIDYLMQLGDTYLDDDQHDHARESYERVQQIDPDSQRAKDGLGKVEFKEGNYDKAAELMAATENAEEIIRFFNNIAIVEVDAGKFEKGIVMYEAALRIMQGKGPIHAVEYNLGLALRKKGDYRKAFDLLADSYKRNPEFTKTYAAFVRVIKAMEKEEIRYNKELAQEIKQLHQSTA